MTLPNGIVAAYAYDAASQLTGITYTRADASLIGDLLYSYNALGHRVGIAGSLAATTLPAAMNSAVYDSANRVTNWNGSGITYDANGNMLSDGARTYTWDAKNRLSAISGGATASFQYDAYGRRLSKTVGGAATGYLYDGANPVQELTGTTPSANILTGLGIDEFYRRTDTSGARDMLADALGSIIALTDSLAQIKTQYSYEPYGATTATGEANTNPFQYTGRENDGTGVYYYRARYYNPAMARFISSDPIGFAGGINTYVYVGNNPLRYIDPRGLLGTEPPIDPQNPSLDPNNPPKPKPPGGIPQQPVPESPKPKPRKSPGVGCKAVFEACMAGANRWGPFKRPFAAGCFAVWLSCEAGGIRRLKYRGRSLCGELIIRLRILWRMHGRLSTSMNH